MTRIPIQKGSQTGQRSRLLIVYPPFVYFWNGPGTYQEEEESESTPEMLMPHQGHGSDTDFFAEDG